MVHLPVLLAAPGLARARTPRQTEGPFYPTPAMRFSDADNDLVRIKGREQAAAGEVVVVKGRVLAGPGKPIAGARVEIWQCDANGRYLHPGDSGGVARDPGFQGFGHLVTGIDGGYAFRTIRPVPYPGRTPHIHVKVWHRGRELTSQLYVAGHPSNARDFLFSRLTVAEQAAVSMVFVAGADGPEATIDLSL